ncbi:toprim domain-containing protein [Alistipes ihumii]|uniref:toprim domain-containing protein n=1 Tax=Alistipes ihumii TaxID=1470347 RepID=UPI003AB8ED02
MTAIPHSNRISIRDFLARRGIQPKYERNGYGMYLSPLREERTPSFKVDYVRNLWYDFGLGEGGTLHTLVMRLERCDSREAIRRLQNGEKRNTGIASLSSGIYERSVGDGPSPVVRPAAVPALRILSDAPLRHPALVGYLASRGIVLSIAAAFCREVRYEVNGRAFFAVGFRNDAGGWELRSARFKGGSSPKHITTLKGCNATNDISAVIDSKAINATSDVSTITASNAITGCPATGATASFHAGNDPMDCESGRVMPASHASIMVFEGFIDFLSYLSLANNIHPVSDTVVLNSVVNLSKAVPYLLQHPVIHAFFDNDEAGRKATSDLLRLCPRSEIVDQSCFYRRHKDVNDYLIARIKDHAENFPVTKSASETNAVQAVRNNLQLSQSETAAIEPQRRKGVKV